MFVMAVGAVICDAGITAILTSIISIRDQQAGTNSRRIQCSKCYMKTCMIDQDLHDRVLNFYEYVDVELENINEDEILSNLSSNLRSEVLYQFCFHSLRTSALTTDMSDGAVRTLVDLMKPYLAIPGEKMSHVDEDCKSIFVLKSGVMDAIDASGYEFSLALGSIIGHLESISLAAQNGIPNKVLQITIISAQNLKLKIGNPYVVFTVGPYSCRSSVKKTKSWEQELLLKLSSKVENTLHIAIKAWQKKQIHSVVGTISTTFDESNDEIQNCIVRDVHGKSVGALKLKLNYRNMTNNEQLVHEKYTTTARSYCHLYQIPSTTYAEFSHYLDLSKKACLENRLSGPFVESQIYEVSFNDNERIKNCWRRPSRPSQAASMHSKKSLIIDRKMMKQQSNLSLEDQANTVNEKTVEASENHRNKNAVLDLFRGNKSATIHPENHGATVDVEQGSIKRSKDELSWRGSNLVKTGTFPEPKHDCLDNSCEEFSEIIEQMSANERQWDVLVDLHSNDNDSNEPCTRRTTLFVEWSGQTSNS